MSDSIVLMDDVERLVWGQVYAAAVVANHARQMVRGLDSVADSAIRAMRERGAPQTAVAEHSPEKNERSAG